MEGIPARLFETVANYTYDWESWMSLQGRPLWINPAVERMTGQGVAACLAMPDYPLPLVAEDDRGRIARLLAAAAAGDSGNDVEFRICRSDGATAWGAMSWQPLYDEQGRPLGFRTSVRDITQRKAAEAEQAAARAAAEEASRAKTRFLAAASHDLRQPIQAAGLFVAALRQRATDPELATLAEQLGQCVTATQELLDALLDISRLDAQLLAPALGEVALSDLFERLELEFARPAAERNLNLKIVASSHFVASDPVLLLRILQNLVANALRYTLRGGVVVGARRQGGRVRIEVHDSGIGIPADKIALVFEEFAQLDNPARDRGKGLGLGLAIVQRLAQLLGLELGVRSTPGRGSCFWLVAPLAAAAPAAPVPPPVPGGRLAGRLVALLEDDPVVRDALGCFLEGEGAEVVAAGEPASLLAALPPGRAPDCLLADYRLRGEATGTAAIDSVEAALGRPLAALLLTGDTEPARLAAAGASGRRVLHKPIEPAALLQAIQEACDASPSRGPIRAP